MNQNFNAFVVEETEPGVFIRNIKARNTEDLPAGDVLIEVHYSALNYKDALSARGHKGITRKYPHTPGIDAAGIVTESKSDKFSAGERVFVTGYDLGMNTSGGFAGFIRVPAEWIVRLPDFISLRESMIYGTAGFTAGICLYEFAKHNLNPGKGKILVTGATGAVGSLAVGMLAKANYDVIASTGKADKHDFLRKLGAKEIIRREDVNDKSAKPLLQKKWLGAIDTVGGNTLSTVIRSTDMHGIVAALGLVESDKLDISLYPFIIRGISLIGIDSAEKSMDLRLEIWNKIFIEWRLEDIEFMIKEVTLNNLNDEIELILRGGQSGKVIIKIRE
jgi:acrylyl-CoA reductase (NADPH)